MKYYTRELVFLLNLAVVPSGERNAGRCSISHAHFRAHRPHCKVLSSSLSGQNVEIFTQLFTIPFMPGFPRRRISSKIRASRLDPWKLAKKTNSCWVISVPSHCKIVVYKMTSCALGNVVLMLTSTSPQGRLFSVTH